MHSNHRQWSETDDILIMSQVTIRIITISFVELNRILRIHCYLCLNLFFKCIPVLIKFLIFILKYQINMLKQYIDPEVFFYKYELFRIDHANVS